MVWPVEVVGRAAGQVDVVVALLGSDLRAVVVSDHRDLSHKVTLAHQTSAPQTDNASAAVINPEVSGSAMIKAEVINGGNVDNEVAEAATIASVEIDAGSEAGVAAGLAAAWGTVGQSWTRWLEWVTTGLPCEASCWPMKT